MNENKELENVPIKPKQHHNLTERQIRYFSARLRGLNKHDSKIEAGYTENVSTKYIEERKGLKEALLMALHRKGLTSQSLAEKLINGLNSKKLLYATFEGKITDKLEVNDNETQHKYFKNALEIRGDISDKTDQVVNIGIVQVPDGKDVEEWNKK